MKLFLNAVQAATILMCVLTPSLSCQAESLPPPAKNPRVTMLFNDATSPIFAPDPKSNVNAKDTKLTTTESSFSASPSPQTDPYFKVNVTEQRRIEPGETTKQASTSASGSALTKVWHLIKGRPADDMIAFGMWSQHWGTDTDYRENNNLIGIQYKGIYASTFANSHSEQTFAVGIARTVFEHDLLFKKLHYSLGYKIGPMYGYKYDGVPNLGGLTLLPMLVQSLDYKRFGFDFNMVPANAVSFNLHIRDPKDAKKRSI